jgi:two-component system sensor histidine kinase and response regulator WspE
LAKSEKNLDFYLKLTPMPPVAAPRGRPTDTNIPINQNMSNYSMMDLFRTEVEAQAAILNEGLLALETNPNDTRSLESMMRAAHSIKGAARIVQINAAVRVAHVMEDCFVASQKGAITLTADSIDVLLRGADTLLRIARVGETELGNWQAEHEAEIEALVTAISAIFTPLPQEATAAPATATPVPPASSPVKESVTVTAIPAVGGGEREKTQPKVPISPPADRVVRMSAENLNRLMGLAGESLVEANWLQPFAQELMKLRNRQAELSSHLEKLQESLEGERLSQRSEEHLRTARQKASECRQMLSERLNELELFARRSANLSDRLYREVIASHMRPFGDRMQGFPRMVRDLARQLGKQVKLEIVGQSTKVDRDILEKLEAPLTHMLRNAIDHGIESPEERLAAGKPAEGTVRLQAAHRAGMLSILVSDDGRGVDLQLLRQTIISRGMVTAEMADRLTETELIDFLFLPGFSTAKAATEISGRGVGLDVVQSVVQEVGGVLRASTQQGLGMSVHLQLPLTLSVIRTLLVEISGEPFAFPLTRIERLVQVPRTDIRVAENHEYFTIDEQNIGLVAADQVLDLKESPPHSEVLPAVVIGDRFSQYGLVVSRFLCERDLVVRPLDPRLGKVKDISAAALLEDGSPVLIVDVEDMVRSIDHLLATGQLSQVGRAENPTASKPRKRILVVDDSITVREMERQLLQNNGYEVEVAVNGMDGWNAIRTGHYDLILTDVDMPRMNGIELVSLIKSHPNLKALPVIIVSYKDREEDRIRGLEAGANYYLTKSSFHDDSLLRAAIDLIGN